MLQRIFSVTTVWSACAVAAFLILVWGMNRLPKKKFSFAQRVLIGSGCGTVFGLAVYGLDRAAGGALIRDGSGWFSLIANGYIALFRVLIVPAVAIAAVRLVIHTPAFKEVPKTVRMKKWVNTLMMVLAAGVSLAFGILFRVGGGTGRVEALEGAGIPELAAGLVPSNIAVQTLTGNIVAVFVIAVLVGIAARRMSGKYMDTVKPFLDLTDAAFSILGSVCKTVIGWKPAGAAAIMTALIAGRGPEGLWLTVQFLLVFILAAACMLAIQTVLCALCGVGPVRFFKAGRAAMVKALKTRSGSACLPEAQEALAVGLGLNREITEEVSSYAIDSGMQGCAGMFPAMALVFAVNLAGGVWTPELIITALIVITAASYGITGVPGTATMAEFAAVMGTGAEGVIGGLGPMIAIDPIGDVFRTLINVTGCMTNAVIVERSVRK